MKDKLELEIIVEKIHVGGDMNRSFKINNPSVLLKLGNGNVSPLPASSLKGLLRQLACIVSQIEGLRDEYFELFGQDLEERCYENGPDEEKPGKLLFVNKGLPYDNVKSIISPGIRINPISRTVAEQGLWFYQYFTASNAKPLHIRYEIWFAEDLTEVEKRLLCRALMLLRHWSIGGKTTIGLGKIIDVKIIKPINFCSER